MKQTAMRAAVISVATGVMGAGLLVSAQTASAQTACQMDWDSADYAITFPDKRPGLSFSDRACTHIGYATGQGRIQADIKLTWQKVVDAQLLVEGKRFESFKVVSRLESRTQELGADTVVTSNSCDLTALINKETVGSFQCAAPAANYDPRLWWSSDATVTYDIVGDDKGAITWQLAGSGLVHGTNDD